MRFGDHRAIYHTLKVDILTLIMLKNDNELLDKIDHDNKEAEEIKTEDMKLLLKKLIVIKTIKYQM